MSHFSIEDENRAQHTEGFNCGYEAGESLYVLTPEDTQQQSDLDEDIYDEDKDKDNEQVPVQPTSAVEPDTPEINTPDETVAVEKKVVVTAPKSNFCIITYVQDPENRLKVLLAVGILCLAIYLLFNQGLIAFPSLPSGVTSALGLDSATSSFVASSSLGQNYIRLNQMM